MDVRLPNGQVVKNVPEGTTRDDLLGKLVSNNIITQGDVNDFQFSRQAIDRETASPALVQFGRGLTDFGEGIKQTALEAGVATGFVSQETLDASNQKAQAERDFFNRSQDIGGMSIARLGGNITSAIIPGMAITKIPAVASVVTQFPKLSAMVGGALGAGTQFIEEDSSLGRGGTAAVGAGAGVVLQKVMVGLTNAISKIPKALSKNVTRNAREGIARTFLQDKGLPKGAVDDIVADVRDGLEPIQAMRKWEIERIGATATKGRISGTIDDLAFENHVERMVDDVDANIRQLQDILEANKQRVQVRGEEIAAELGPASTKTDAGAVATRVLTEAKKTAKKEIVEPAFELADSIVQQHDHLQGSIGNLRKAMLDNIDELQTDSGLASINSSISRFIGENLDDVAQAEMKSLRLARKAIQKIKPKDGNVARVQKDILNGIDQDITQTLGADLQGMARGVSKKEFYDKFVNPRTVSELLDGNVSPESLVDKVMGKKWSLDETEEFFRVLDGVDPQAGNLIRRAVGDDIVKSLRALTVNVKGEAQTNVATFIRKLDSLTDSRMDVIFGPGARNDFRVLADSAKKILTLDRRTVGSTTSRDIKNTMEAMQGAGYTLLSRGHGLAKVAGNIMIYIGRVLGGNLQNARNRELAREAINQTLLKRQNLMGEVLDLAVDTLPQQSIAGGVASASPEVREEALAQGQNIATGAIEAFR